MKITEINYEEAKPLSTREADVLAHTYKYGRFVTTDRFVLMMAKAGLLRDHGPQQLAGGAHYLSLTAKGRDAFSAWRNAQPKPAKVKRRSKMFDSWQSYQEAYGLISFPDFLKLGTTNEA